MSNHTHSIIGLGDMGIQIAEILYSNGIEDISYYHPKEDVDIPDFLEGREVDLEHAVSQAHVRWFCGPLSLMPEIIEGSGQYIRMPGTTDIEIASVKIPQENALSGVRADDGRVIQIHSMHKRMSLENLAGERVFITSPTSDWGGDPDVRFAKEHIAPLFEHVDEQVMYATNQEHDNYTAAVQGLRMLSLLTVAASLQKPSIKGIDLPMPSYENATHNQQIFYCNAARLLTISPDTVAGIMIQNPRVLSLAQSFYKNLEEISKLFCNQDTESLIELRDTLTDFVGGDYMAKAHQLRDMNPDADPAFRMAIDTKGDYEIGYGVTWGEYEAAMLSRVQQVAYSYVKTLKDKGMSIEDSLRFVTPAFDLSLRMFFDALAVDPSYENTDSELRFRVPVVGVARNLVDAIYSGREGYQVSGFTIPENLTIAKDGIFGNGDLLKRAHAESVEMIQLMKTDPYRLNFY